MTDGERHLRGFGLSLLTHVAVITVAVFLFWSRPAPPPDPESTRWDVDLFDEKEPPPPPIPERPPMEPETSVEPAMEQLPETLPQMPSDPGAQTRPLYGMPSIELPGQVSSGTIAIPETNLLGSTLGGPSFGNGAPAGDLPAPNLDPGLIATLRIPPTYPIEARRKRIEGWVRVEMTVLEDGSVTGVKVREARPANIFDQAAIAAVSRWKFRPPTDNGKPVRRRAAQTVRFELRN